MENRTRSHLLFKVSQICLFVQTFTVSTSRHMDPQQPVHPNVITAFFTLGRTYRITKLTEHAVGRLRYEYPRSLASCDIMLLQPNVMIRPLTPSGAVKHDFFHDINFAREVNYHIILPWAYYGCYAFVPLGEIKSTKDLSKLDRDIIVNGYHRLDAFRQTTAYPWLGASFPICQTPEQCLKSRAQLLTVLRGPGCKLLDAWKAVWEEFLCYDCTLVMQGKYEQGRRDVWDRLPGYFGLPTWVELTDQSRYVSPFLFFIS